MNGIVYLPSVGYIILKHKEGRQVKKRTPDGGSMIYTIPDRDVPQAKYDDDFINDINMSGITKNYRQRLKAGRMNERDMRREARKKEILGDDLMITPTEYESMKEIPVDFKDFLNKLHEKERKKQEKKALKEEKNDTEEE